MLVSRRRLPADWQGLSVSIFASDPITQAPAEAEGATRGDALRKAGQRPGQPFLTAPVLGVAQQLTLTPIGEAPEVVTGRRRVIDCLWSPVAKAAREAGRER